MASRRVECITFLGRRLLILLRLRGASEFRSTDSTMWRVSSVGPLRGNFGGIGSACIGPWYEFIYYMNLYPSRADRDATRPRRAERARVSPYLRPSVTHFRVGISPTGPVWASVVQRHGTPQCASCAGTGDRVSTRGGPVRGGGGDCAPTGRALGVPPGGEQRILADPWLRARAGPRSARA